MSKSKKRNKKGSVLLAVLCFTTIMMITATVAMKLSMFSNSVSTTNVMKTQADITAENYLEQYINTYGGSYENLSAIAGSTEASATTVTCDITSPAGTPTAGQVGGSCEIKIFKDINGNIIVRADADYQGTKSSTSAYFKSTSTPNPIKQNALVTCGNYTTDGIGTPINGDVCVESTDLSKTIVFQNNSHFKCNAYFQPNIYFNTAPDFNTTIQGKAPILRSDGYIFSPNNSFTIKSDSAVKDITTSEDGYVCTESKMIIMQCNIGTSQANPIDVFCRGAYFGGVPGTLCGPLSSTGTTNNSSERNNILSIFSGSPAWAYVGESSSCSPTINGNVYCYKGAGSTQDGNMVIACESQTVTINGDLCVEGDIYLNGDSRLVVKGNLHLGGNIYHSNSGMTDNRVTPSYTTTPNGAAVYRPGSTSKWVTIEGTFDNSISKIDRGQWPKNPFTTTKVFSQATPNTMFLNSIKLPTNPSKSYAVDSAGYYIEGDFSDTSKDISTKFTNAYHYNYINTDPMYSDPNNWAMKSYVKDTVANTIVPLCVYDASTGNYTWNTSNVEQKDGYKVVYVYENYRYDYDKLKSKLGDKIMLYVVLKDKDIIIDMPSGTTLNGQNERILIDKFTNKTTVEANDAFCYFMLYNKNLKNADGTDREDDYGYYYMSGEVGTNAEHLSTGPNSIVYKYTDDSSRPYFKVDNSFMMSEIDTTGYVVNNYAAGTTKDIRTMLLLPDYTHFEMGSNNNRLNAVVYTPKGEARIVSNNCQIYGQLIVDSCKRDQEAGADSLNQIEYPTNSILEFIDFLNNPVSKTELLYFAKK